MAETIASVQRGPIRASITANQKALALFRQREQNEIIRNAMQRTGDFWLVVFMPRRFTDYARRFLRYNPFAKWEDTKVALAKRGVIASPQPTPMVYTGISRATALSRSRAEGRATKTKAVAIVRMPLGHAVRPQISKIFKYLPRHEVERIAQVFDKALVEAIADGFKARASGAQQRPAAAPAARSGVAVTTRKRAA